MNLGKQNGFLSQTQICCYPEVTVFIEALFSAVERQERVRVDKDKERNFRKRK